MNGANSPQDDAAQGSFLAGLAKIAAIPGLSAGTSRQGARAFADGGDRPTAGLAQYRIASLTKSFTSAAAALTLAAQRIPLSVPAVELLPSLAADWRADPAITVGQLLGQVSGLRQAVDARTLIAAGISDGAEAIGEAARLVVLAGSEQVPGERWAYYNGNYFIVGAILEAVTGASYEEVVERAVLRPWSLGRTGFGTPDAAATGNDGGSPVPAGGFPRARRPSGGLCGYDVSVWPHHDGPAWLHSVDSWRVPSSPVKSGSEKEEQIRAGARSRRHWQPADRAGAETSRPSGADGGRHSHLWSCAADLMAFAERLLATPALIEETRRPRTRSRGPMTYGLGWAIGPSGQLYLNGRLPGYRTAFLLSPAHGYASVALASQTDALPGVARLLSELQQPLTGDDLSRDINAFAA